MHGFVHAASPRRLFAWFLITTSVGVAGLAWLMWLVVRDDAIEQRDRALDGAVGALQRTLARITEESRSMTPTFTVLEFDQALLVRRKGPTLPYYPSAPAAAVSDDAPFAAADMAEFAKQNVRVALTDVESLTTGQAANVRAEAWLRMARLERKLGRFDRALSAYDALSRFEDIEIGGLPAGLLARQGRALVLEQLGRESDLAREADRLLADLVAGKWVLTRQAYDFSMMQALRWQPQPAADVPRDRVMVADAVASLRFPPAAQATLTTASGCVFAFSTETAGRTIVGLVPMTELYARWMSTLGKTPRGIAWTLTVDGRTVLGSPDVSSQTSAARFPPETQLPWTVHAVSTASVFAPSALTPRARILASAAGLMSLMLVGGAWFINRAVARELAAARIQSDFVAAVSHEFRTPLTSIRQLSELLAGGRVSTDERRGQFYGALLRESDRLHRLIEGLLTFGRMEAGQQHYLFEPIDTTAVLRSVVSEFEPLAAATGHCVELHAAASVLRVRADWQSIGRVFWNLLDNAVKYSPECKTVWITAEALDQNVLIRVRDEGVGIPREEQASIFQKFVRGTQATRDGIAGTGVGLAMAAQIVSAHGGRLSVDSHPGGGSTFSVVLPGLKS